MSLIGPRPEQVGFVEEFQEKIPFYAYRHMVKPGISGWAQVSHGYAACLSSAQEKLEYDLYYAKHCSFWLDTLITLRTFRTILTGFGVR
jgi:lipopolysaccharide/colanic/teichoic acid biosynthesis glycosyltransferase